MRVARKRALSGQQRKYATCQAAFRSGLEEQICAGLKQRGVPYRYEAFKIKYRIPASDHTYTPDLMLPNGIVIELKGLWVTEDRRKHKLVKAQHPELDIRIVFSNANAKIAKGSKTSYALYAETMGMKWGHKDIPQEWLTEAPNKASIKALEAMGAWKWN